MKPTALAPLVAAVLVACGIWWYKHRAPAEITEEQARAIGEKAFGVTCGAGAEEGGSLKCGDFKFEGIEVPEDKRFAWSYRYDAIAAGRGLRVQVMVGKKGEVRSLQSFFTPNLTQAAAAPGKPAAQGASVAAKSAAASPAPAPPKPAAASVESSASWTLCELPPAGP